MKSSDKSSKFRGLGRSEETQARCHLLTNPRYLAWYKYHENMQQQKRQILLKLGSICNLELIWCNLLIFPNCTERRMWEKTGNTSSLDWVFWGHFRPKPDWKHNGEHQRSGCEDLSLPGTCRLCGLCQLIPFWLCFLFCKAKIIVTMLNAIKSPWND